MPKRTVLDHVPFRWFAHAALLAVVLTTSSAYSQADTTAQPVTIDGAAPVENAFRLRPSLG